MRRAMVGVLVVLAVMLAACSSDATTGDGGDGGDGGGKWVKVITLKGSTAKTSAPFKLEGGEQRLDYQLKGGDMVIASFYVEPKGTDLMEEGGFPVAMPEKSGKDSTRLNKEAGEYILIVDAANCSWSCTLYEKR